MAKRFIDTDIFSDPFFMDLSKDGKLFYVYCITNCDHAGILELNRRLCEFQTGIDCLATVIKELSNRLVTVKDNTYFLPKFIDYQYPNFPNSNVRQQQSAIKILEKYGLFDTKNLTVSKHLPKCYGNEHVNGNVTEEENKEEKKENLIKEKKEKITNPKSELSPGNEPQPDIPELGYQRDNDSWDVKVSLIANDQNLIELTMRNTGMDERQTKRLINAFLFEIKTREETDRTVSDMRRYFINWAKSSKNKELITKPKAGVMPVRD